MMRHGAMGHGVHGVLSPLMVGGLSGGYKEKVLATGPGAYYPLLERTGSVVADWANGLDGTSARPIETMTTGVGIGDGNTAPLFNGTSDIVDIYSAALATLFSGTLFSVAVWFRVLNVGVWTDGVNRRLFTMGADASNLFRFRKSNLDNRFSYDHVAGGTTENLDIAPVTVTTWQHALMTVTKAGDLVSYYLNGALEGTDSTIGVWAGALASTLAVIGAEDTTPGAAFSGYLAHFAYWTRIVTPDEIANLAVVS